jgi:phosphatidylserine/phosphatidylglycerophosphate/cardiolipin synthase-like enzyme
MFENMFDRLRSFGRIVWPYALFAVVIIPITTVVTTVRYDSKFRVVYSLDRRDTDSEIIRLINGADRYVYFAIYYFTKTDIADALIRAQKRGVTVWGITDAAASLDSNKNIMDILRAAGISVETQKHQDGIMHMKAIVTDKAYASGSYNWTASATESNDEVLEIGTDKSVHDQYLAIIKKVLLTNQ